jgi:Protein of unknown function (DUF433)
MRIPVELILSLLAQGVATEEILDDYPDLQKQDIQACLAYARAAIAGDRLEAVEVGQRVEVPRRPLCRLERILETHAADLENGAVVAVRGARLRVSRHPEE